LTRKHIRLVTSDWDENEILNPLSYIFKIAGWDFIDDGGRRGAFQQKLRRVLKAVDELRLAIGEQLISADIHIALMDSDQPFAPKDMEDAYEDVSSSLLGTQGRPPPKVVLGTVGVGLHQVSKDQLLSGTLLDYHIIKPAKVVLVSTVMEALARPPRRSNNH